MSIPLAFDILLERTIPWAGWLTIQVLFVWASWRDWYYSHDRSSNKSLLAGMFLSIAVCFIVLLAFVLDVYRLSATKQALETNAMIEHILELLAVFIFPMWATWLIYRLYKYFRTQSNA